MFSRVCDYSAKHLSGKAVHDVQLSIIQYDLLSHLDEM